MGLGKIQNPLISIGHINTKDGWVLVKLVGLLKDPDPLQQLEREAPLLFLNKSRTQQNLWSLQCLWELAKTKKNRVHWMLPLV